MPKKYSESPRSPRTLFSLMRAHTVATITSKHSWLSPAAWAWFICSSCLVRSRYTEGDEKNYGTSLGYPTTPASSRYLHIRHAQIPRLWKRRSSVTEGATIVKLTYEQCVLHRNPSHAGSVVTLLTPHPCLGRMTNEHNIFDQHCNNRHTSSGNYI